MRSDSDTDIYTAHVKRETYMKVQRIQLPDTGGITWTVLDDAYLPIMPAHQFLEHLLLRRQCSPNTIRSYASHLRFYWEFLGQRNLEWVAVRRNELDDYVQWLCAPLRTRAAVPAQRRESTVNVMVEAVLSCYAYHAQRGTVAAFLATTTTRPRKGYFDFRHHRRNRAMSHRLTRKAARVIRIILDDDEFARLCNACSNRRDRFLICLLYETGMRIGQALGLRHEDIHSCDNEIVIVPREDNVNGARAKTNQPNCIPVSEALMALYTDYLVHEFGDTESDYVFVNLWRGNIGHPVRYSTAIDLCRRLFKKTGIALHPHLLRHTHATNLIDAGMDIVFVQKRLGHKSAQTTSSIYVNLRPKQMKANFQEYEERVKRRKSHGAAPTSTKS